MDCNVPTSDIIPAVAARLKYYLDVERKEAAFDLSTNQPDSNINYKLYQFTGSHELHRAQKIKNNLDNKMEASLHSYTGRSGAEWNQKILINREWKQQVQRKLRKKMSFLTMPDHISSNHAGLKIFNCKCSDWGDFGSGAGNSSPPDISPGEFRRLVASAANLIVAATSGHSLKHSQQSRKAISSDGGSRTHRDENTAQTAAETSENIDYEIAIHTSASSLVRSLFIRLVGDNGRSNILFLQNSLVKSAASYAGQTAVFQFKTKDVGELKYVIIGVDRTRQDCRCYCRNVTVKKGTTDYVFPCNKWLSPLRAVMIHATQAASTANVIPAPRKGATTAPDCRTSSKGLKISSCRHVEKAAKKDTPDKLQGPKRNVTKPVASNGRLKSKERAAVSNHGSRKKLPEVSSAEKAPKAALSEEKAGSETDSVTKVWDNPTKPIDSTEDEDLHLPVLGESNVVDIIVDNLPVQDKTQIVGCTTAKYKASSPASYVFFSHESKGSPLNVEVSAKRMASSGLSIGDRREAMNVSSDGKNQSISGCSRDEFDSKSSQLLLLQQLLLESEDGSTLGSPQLDSQPIYSCVDNAEETVAANVDEDIEVCSGYIRSGCQPDSGAAQTSGYWCSCGYESDSTNGEHFLFFDTSLDLSLSEDEDPEMPTKSSNSGEQPEENNGEQGTKKDVYYRHASQEQSLDCSSENLNLFESSLAAIHSNDYVKLRNLCQIHFFIPSFTDGEGKTLLHHAASHEDPRSCQVLLATNVGMVNIDHQDVSGKTALHYAVQNGNSKTIKLLLDNGAKSEIPDQNDKTVLDFALGKIQTK